VTEHTSSTGLAEPAPEPSAWAPASVRQSGRRRLWWFNTAFVLSVLLPTSLAAIYFGLVASDVYISESRFVVRSPQRPSPTGLGALLQGTVFSRSQDDTYSVHDFVRSRDALRELDERLSLRAMYSADAIDFVNRFPGLEAWDDSFEALFRHYLRHVSVDYDPASSISVLKVRAYRPEDARRINATLLDMGERLMNNTNERSRQDLIKVAQQEVTVAEERAKQAAAALASFRSSRGVFDPDRQSALQLQAAARLREEFLAAESQLEQVRRVSPRNPQVGGLETRVQSLKLAIERERALMHASAGGLTSMSPAFDRLVLERTFADRQVTSALAALDSARSEASRKQLYLERLVMPNLPDSALEPRRIRGFATTLMLGLMFWGIVSLVIASIREHTD
jgi:capsular polysaccharide transport system permease protein